MASWWTVSALGLAVVATAQQIGTAIPEVHPKLTTFTCTTSGGCVEKKSALVTDALSRPLHAMGNMDVSCATMPLNATLCPDAATCARNCVLEGVEYGSMGVLASGSALTLRQYLNNGTGFAKVSPRLYLLAEDEQNYEMLRLVNQELSYDVDMSKMVCGMNGALYLSEMEASGSRTELNPAGAAYGTGYCDAQCFSTPSWINGIPNMNNSGACCNEMDIWEANGRATVYTPHTCNGTGSFLCSGDGCTKAGVCDKDGCGLNPYASGQKDFYGPGLTVDTSKPFTVVTQFLSSDNTATGMLTEIRRLYVQGNRVIENVPVDLSATAAGAITDEYCTARNRSDFLRLGGLVGMGESLKRGMVLIFSIWNSDGDFMQWLDGGNSGPCSTTEGDPKLILERNPDVSVTFANVRWGDIGSTFNSDGSTASFGLVGAATQGAASFGQKSLSTLGSIALAVFVGTLVW